MPKPTTTTTTTTRRPPRPTTTTTTTTTPKPRHPKPYKKFLIRIYSGDGSYNAELIDEFVFRAPHSHGFGGLSVRNAEAELEFLLYKIGEHGHIVELKGQG